MKRITSAIVVTSLLITSSHADVIKPNDVRATSQFGVGANIQNLVNGDQGPAIGLTDFGLFEDPNSVPDPNATVFDYVHEVTAGFPPIPPSQQNQTYWISGCSDAGIPGGSAAEERGADCGDEDPFADPGPFSTQPINDQIIEFEFDGAYDLTAAHIWNDNEDGFAADRGLKLFHTQYSTDRTGDTFIDVDIDLDPNGLDARTGFSLATAQKVSFTDPNGVPMTVSGARRVRFLLDSAFFGDPNALDLYVGLSEVRFEGTLDTLDLAADGTGLELDDPNDFFNQHRGKKDGAVSGLDFLLWQAWLGRGEYDGDPNHPRAPVGYIPPLDPNGQPEIFNSTLTSTQSTGDYDNNNVTNHADLAIWEAQFGMSSPLSGFSGASVPEPLSLYLVATAALGGLLVRRRRIRNRSPGD